jgi:hypothetical protein
MRLRAIYFAATAFGEGGDDSLKARIAAADKM